MSDSIVVTPDEKKTVATAASESLIERICSAFAGAVVTTCFMNPLDVVKTRLQEASKTIQYKGTIDALVKIIGNDGFYALWRGLVPGLVMSLPSTSIFYVGYDHIRDYTRTSRFANTNVDVYAPLWGGGMARAVASFAVSPLELFKTRMQSANTHGFSDVWVGVVKMVQAEGPQALWRGLVPTMFRDIPFSAVYWMAYEEVKSSLQTYPLSHFERSFLSGASSGMLAAVITTPFDVIKTQLQVSPDPEEAKLSKILQNIMVKDGPTGFFRGVVPRVVRVAPACAIMISSYEMGKRFFADRKNAQQRFI